MSITNTLYVPERSAAILSRNGNCRLISILREYDKKKRKNVETETERNFTGIKNLKTRVFTCAGIVFKNSNYILIHAVQEPEQENLKELLERVRYFIDDKIFLCTTNPFNYEKAVYDSLGNVEIRKFSKYSGNLGIMWQDIKVGKDGFYPGGKLISF